MSDQELIDQFKQTRDLAQLGLLYKRYMLLVYGVCMKYLKNRDDSQDAVMQIFETLIDEIPKFEIRNFKNWLYGVTRNHCLMKIRKDHAVKSKAEKFYDTVVMESDSVLHPIEETDNTEIQDKLKTCLEQLKEDQRRCVELFYYRQQCYKEIASTLDMNENKVKSNIQNGKRNLKLCIESKAIMNNVRS